MIDIKNLTINYDKKVIDDISFTIEPGKVNVLMGRNGAGKSSILNAISGLISYDGNIRADGKISYLNQNVNTKINFTVFETIILGKVKSLNFKLSDEDINDTYEIMDLLKLRKFENKKISKMSGGEVQKVLIAQALISKPDILLLDEPVSALDLHNQYEILAIIKKLTQKLNLTTLITLHQMELIERYADNIILINNNKIYEVGDKYQIFTKKMFDEVYNIDANISKMDDNLLFLFNMNNKQQINEF
ncbi:ABC transporter ATP-binding protein [uncultured Anaerococcus sp.]|uniref:ABC transporter ATP-binding protein n=1 Tax=uncultured Anaerococcus sp. TaxID=293428 RepID=UPI0025E9FD18|nr:ABC transporter ATP-binding protein [uncultured Anaerococcus sp.]